MAEGRAKLEWSQTAELLAVLYNANRDPKKRSRPFQASEFNPYAERAKEPDTATRITSENIGLLRTAFTGQSTKGASDARQ